MFTKTNLPTIRLSQAKPPSSNFHAHDLNPRNPTKDGSPKSPLRNSRADLLISRAPQTLGLRTGRPELKPRYRSFNSRGQSTRRAPTTTRRQRGGERDRKGNTDPQKIKNTPRKIQYSRPRRDGKDERARVGVPTIEPVGINERSTKTHATN